MHVASSCTVNWICEVHARNFTLKCAIAADQVASWSDSNRMNIKKTKEILIGSISNLPPTLVTFHDRCIGRVSSYKLLGVIVCNNLSWDEHINYICLKANKRLHFLKLLKRSRMSPEDMLQY
jgi:hypothetical protein